VYKESARLLKGVGWKVNFRSRGEYEDARAREIGVAGGTGGEGGSPGLLRLVRSEAHRAGYRWLEGAANQFRCAWQAGPAEAKEGGDTPYDGPLPPPPPPPPPLPPHPSVSEAPESGAPPSAPPAAALMAAPPAIQNGTLAAASALVTLLGKERGGLPQG
jgi:hypothetical protein